MKQEIRSEKETVKVLGHVVALVACAACAAQAGAAGSGSRWRVVDGPGAPFKIVGLPALAAKQDALDRRHVIYVLGVTNVSTRILARVAVSGSIFSSAGGRKGGFVFAEGVALEPQRGAQVRFRVPLRAIAAGDTVVLTPVEADFAAQGDDAERWKTSILDVKQLVPDLVPDNVAPAGPREPFDDEPFARLRLNPPGQPQPDLACSFCDTCASQAHTCGDNFLRGNCGTSACVNSLSCTCRAETLGECNFTCRSPEFCCN